MKRSGNLDGHVTGTATERNEDKLEENTARNRMQPARDPMEKEPGEVDTIFWGGVEEHRSLGCSIIRRLDNSAFVGLIYELLVFSQFNVEVVPLVTTHPCRND